MKKFETVPAMAGTHIPVRAGISAGAPVAVFDGYVNGTPSVKWLDHANMPPAGTKLHTGAQLDKLLTIIASAYQFAGKHDCPARILDVLANPGDATDDKVAAMLPYQPGPAPAMRSDFIEWHTDKFGYCFDDEQSFTDGGLQAVAWAAWNEARARSVQQADRLPKTGITAAEVAAVLDDLERNCGHAVSTGIRAHNIIEGLLSGLDVGQLS